MNNLVPNEKSSIPKPTDKSPIDITRLVYLTSEPLQTGEASTNVPIKATQSQSPANKTWVLPPHQDNVTMYKLNLRNLHIFHTWPSVREDQPLEIRNADPPGGTPLLIDVKRGNWGAASLAKYITDQFIASNINNEMTYNACNLSFSFQYPVDILSFTSMKMLSILGLPQPQDPENWMYSNISGSSIPIKLSGPCCIHVNTDFPLYNIPSSGRLATIGVDKCYGELLMYFDESATQPPLLTSNYISTINIQLTDEMNEELECYDEIPWQCVLSIDAIDNKGYEPLQTSISGSNIDSKT